MDLLTVLFSHGKEIIFHILTFKFKNLTLI